MFLQLYKALVRPHLEYANVIWHPQFKRQSQLIEKVQRRATKILCDIKDYSYQERLLALNLPSLKYRRLRADLIQTFKIIHDIDNINVEDFFKFCNYKTREQDLKLYKSYARTNTRYNFFCNRVVNKWNYLSASTRRAPSINSFKKGVDHDLSHLQFDFDD